MNTKVTNPVATVAELFQGETTDSKASNSAPVKKQHEGKQTQGDRTQDSTIKNRLRSSANEQESDAEDDETSDNEKVDKNRRLPDENDPDHVEDDESGGDLEGDPDADGEGEEKPVLLADIAKELDLEDGDLYEVQIPLGKNKTISLGEMKDAYNAMAPKMERLERLEFHEMELQHQVARTQRQVEDIVAHLPVQMLTPQYMQKVEDYQRARSSQEMDRLLAVKPEWRDPGAGAAAKHAMKKAAANYGLTDKDVDMISDHRWLLALNDLAVLKDKFSRASSEVKKVVSADRKVPKKDGKAVKGGLATKLAERAKGGNKQAQAQLISELFTPR